MYRAFRAVGKAMIIQSDRILAEATRTGTLRGNEWAWKPSELPAVFQKAKELKIAAIGGTAQFRLPDGTCELYWISIDTKLPTDNETWEEYAIRSNDEALAQLTHQTQTINFHREAANWSFVSEHTLDRGIDPLDFLCYVFYFSDEREFIDLKKWAEESGMTKHFRPSKFGSL